MNNVNNMAVGESARQMVQVRGGASSTAEARQETDGAVAAARAEMAEGRAALATKFGTLQFYPTYGTAAGAIALNDLAKRVFSLASSGEHSKVQR